MHAYLCEHWHTPKYCVSLIRMDFIFATWDMYCPELCNFAYSIFIECPGSSVATSGCSLCSFIRILCCRFPLLRNCVCDQLSIFKDNDRPTYCTVYASCRVVKCSSAIDINSSNFWDSPVFVPLYPAQEVTGILQLSYQELFPCRCWYDMNIPVKCLKSWFTFIYLSITKVHTCRAN